jgi:hypothetical protein
MHWLSRATYVWALTIVDHLGEAVCGELLMRDRRRPRVVVVHHRAPERLRARIDNSSVHRHLLFGGGSGGGSESFLFFGGKK